MAASYPPRLHNTYMYLPISLCNVSKSVNFAMILTSLSHAGLIAALAGPISHHLIWIRCEWDAIFYKITAAALVFQPLALLLLRFGGAHLVTSLVALSVLQTSYLVSLFTSIAIYRLFFHSTGKFPGPFWARLWQWWKVYQFAKSEKPYGIVHELHQKYGDVVRIGQPFPFDTVARIQLNLYRSTTHISQQY